MEIDLRVYFKSMIFTSQHILAFLPDFVLTPLLLFSKSLLIDLVLYFLKANYLLLDFFLASTL